MLKLSPRGKKGYWIVGINPIHGPYETKGDAENDRIGLVRAIREMGKEEKKEILKRVVMQVNHNDLLDIFAGIGQDPAGWSRRRMQRKIKSLPDMVEDGFELSDGNLNTILWDLIANVDSGEPVEVVVEEVSNNGETEVSEVAETQTEEVAETQTEVPKEEVTTERGVVTEKPKKERKKQEIRKNSRVYLSGVILKKHGVDKGITEEMISDLNELHGKANDSESKAWLQNSLKAITGYLAE